MKNIDIQNAPMVRLGELIEECKEQNKNKNKTLTLDNVRGISINKKFIQTKANMKDVSLASYKIVEGGWYCYAPVTSRNGNKISLAFNREQNLVMISSTYIVFRSKNEKLLFPEYLYLLLNRDEFDRYSRFNSWGSTREVFSYEELCNTKIPLPSIETQRELVAVYEGMQKIIDDNEELIKNLELACHSFIVDCKTKYPKEKIGEYIYIVQKSNIQNLSLPFLGINKNKSFMPTVANTEGVARNKYLILDKGLFVFSGMQTGRDMCIRIGLYNDENSSLISPAYTTFRIKYIKKILPEFFMLQFKRNEMDRLGWFKSDGSIRSNLDWDRFCEFQIPLPPIEIQESIVNVYHCMEEAKNIVRETKELMKNICPALIQKAAHSA